MRYTALVSSVLLASAIGLVPASAKHSRLKAHPDSAAPAAIASAPKTDPIGGASTNHILVTPTAASPSATARTSPTASGSSSIQRDPPGGQKGHVFRVVPPSQP